MPRAISVLASYDVERRSIPDRTRAEQFVPRGLPASRTAYPLFAFLVPTAALAEAGDPYRYPHGDTAQVLDAIVNRLRPLVDTLTRDAPTSGQTDNSWYAVAPLLLDGASPDSVTWMRQYPDSGHRSADTDNGEHTVWSDLVAIVSDQLAQRLANLASLGRAPEDLAERLALLALASPANASLRALSRVTAMPPSSPELKREALQAAWGFRSFFRSPTSEGLLQNVYSPSISANAGTYLQRVLAYCMGKVLYIFIASYWWIQGHISRTLIER